MDQGVKRTQRDYSLAFKLAVVDQIEKGELTYKQAQARYGIQGRSTVLVWLRKHGRQDWSQGASIRPDRSKAMTDPANLTPEQRIRELEQQLQVMSQKAQFFEAVGAFVLVAGLVLSAGLAIRSQSRSKDIRTAYRVLRQRHPEAVHIGARGDVVDKIVRRIRDPERRHRIVRRNQDIG